MIEIICANECKKTFSIDQATLKMMEMNYFVCKCDNNGEKLIYLFLSKFQAVMAKNL